MLIRFATAHDIPAWEALATAVSPLFQHPTDLGHDPEFREYLRRKVAAFEALVAVDYRSGACMGFLGFSRTHNHDSWFAVAEVYRGKGVGSRLLMTAIRQLDHTQAISVVTFTAEYPPGRAARTLYQRFGFADSEETLLRNSERCRFYHDFGRYRYSAPESPKHN